MNKIHLPLILGFPCSSVGKESAYSAGDPGLIPGLGRSPGEGNGNPFQYSCLGESHGVACLPGSFGHGIARVRHDLATKPPPPLFFHCFFFLLNGQEFLFKSFLSA